MFAEMLRMIRFYDIISLNDPQETCVMDRFELLKSARYSYNAAQKEIIELTKILQRTNHSVSIKQNLVAFDALLQLIMVNVATQDGVFLKSEKDYITQFCDNIDIMQVSGYSWDAFLRLDSATLKAIVAEVNTKTMELLSTTFSVYHDICPDKLLKLEMNVSNMCHCLTCIDGDTCDSPDYIREWGAGIEIFDKAFKQRALCIAPTKTVFYGFGEDYHTKDIDINIEGVYFVCSIDECFFTLNIKNKQHKRIRVWIKNIGIWADNGDQEICDEYKLLAEIEGYKQDKCAYKINNSFFNNLYLTPCYVDNNPYDTSKCCSELVFMLTYDFGDSDIDVSKWVLDSNDFCLLGNYACNNDECEQNDNTSYEQGELDASSWSVESILRHEGYTVSKKEGLTDYERQAILRKVIENGKMGRNQAIDHIELQINLRKHNSIYNIAISKWERDLMFLKSL